jgi:hypothetical protein
MTSMYVVFASDADALRALLDRPKRLLEHPFCGYLIYLARSVDRTGAEFLQYYSHAVDVETGEALAFLVLLDTAVTRGARTSLYPGEDRDPVPTFDVAEAVEGTDALHRAVAHRFRGGSIPVEAFYRASPEWSLKFADHIGLHRSYLPCIVAMDDPRASSDDRCAVISLADPEAAWETLKGAIAQYVAQPQTQVFMLASERVRTAQRRLADLRRARIPDLCGPAQRLISRLPAKPDAVLDWVANLDADDRERVADAAGDSEVLSLLLTAPPSPASRRDLQRSLHKIRGTWLRSPTSDNPHIHAKLVTELTALLRRLDRPATDLDLLWEMTERANRQAFLVQAAAAPFTVDQLHDCWTHLHQHVGGELLRLAAETTATRQHAARRAFAEATAELARAEEALRAAPRTPFVPHLTRATDIEPARRRKRPAGVAVATGVTAFVADIVQILQGIGAIR